MHRRVANMDKIAADDRKEKAIRSTYTVLFSSISARESLAGCWPSTVAYSAVLAEGEFVGCVRVSIIFPLVFVE